MRLFTQHHEILCAMLGLCHEIKNGRHIGSYKFDSHHNGKITISYKNIEQNKKEHSKTTLKHLPLEIYVCNISFKLNI